MKKGIIIYAIGHKNYYRMAENLAASLIANGSRYAGISICLICDSKEKLLHKSLFDDFILLDEGKYMVDGKIVFTNAIILAYDLSPYDITIKLDADMIWIKGRNVSDLFEELSGFDFTISNTGHGWGKGNSIWADENKLMEAYSLSGEEKLYRLYGEFFYFEKGPVAKAFFKKAKEIYFKKKIKGVPFSNGHFTEELAFQLAIMLTGKEPHKDGFTPIFNKFLGLKHLNRKYPFELTGFYGYSIGGNSTDQFTKDNYNTLAKHYFATLGLFNPYQVENKRSYLPERKLL